MLISVLCVCMSEVARGGAKEASRKPPEAHGTGVRELSRVRVRDRLDRESRGACVAFVGSSLCVFCVCLCLFHCG